MRKYFYLPNAGRPEPRLLLLLPALLSFLPSAPLLAQEEIVLIKEEHDLLPVEQQAQVGLVKDFDPSGEYNYVYVDHVTNVNGTLFFRVYKQKYESGVWTTIQSLWKSDGTEAGTVMVKDIYPGTVSSYSAFPVVCTALLLLYCTPQSTLHEPA